MSNRFSRWQRSPNRFMLEKWFWGVMTLVVVPLALLLPHFWAAISIVYVAAISGYALYATFAGAEQGARAKENTRHRND